MCVQPHRYSNLACVRLVLMWLCTYSICYPSLNFYFLPRKMKSNTWRWSDLKHYSSVAVLCQQKVTADCGLGLLSPTSVQSQLDCWILPWLVVCEVVQPLMENNCRNLLLNCYSCFRIIANCVGSGTTLCADQGFVKNAQSTTSHLNNSGECFRSISALIVRWEERQFLAKTGLPKNEFIRIKLESVFDSI